MKSWNIHFRIFRPLKAREIYPFIKGVGLLGKITFRLLLSIFKRVRKAGKYAGQELDEQISISVTLFCYLQIKSVVFDKTGTITHGKPVVTQTKLFVPSTVCSLRPFLAIVGTAEGSSEHPIGLAISQNSKDVLETAALGQCTDFEAVPGHGLRCVVAGIERFANGESVSLKPVEGLPKGTYEVPVLFYRIKLLCFYHSFSL